MVDSQILCKHAPKVEFHSFLRSNDLKTGKLPAALAEECVMNIESTLEPLAQDILNVQILDIKCTDTAWT